jgi:hypothetical protein
MTFLKPDQIETIIPLHRKPERVGKIFAQVGVKLGVYANVAVHERGAVAFGLQTVKH